MLQVLFNHSKDNIELLCTDDYKKRCYPVLANFMVDLKELVFIINIQAKMLIR